MLETSLGEILLRGSAVYLVLTVVLRVVPKRHIGSIAPNDIIALVIIGSLAADGIMGDVSGAADIVLMIVVILLWDYAFNLAEYHLRWFRRVAQHTPTLLIHQGQLLPENLRREKLTEQELMAALRLRGIDELSRVRQAVLEVDGDISVIEQDRGAS